ncbi:MAG: addiction module protein [bacterium]|nr:addiction module protein [bacterium]
MTFKQIEYAALELPEASRADLAQSLLQSLGEATEDPAHDQVWAEEAARRYRDLRDNPAAAVPAEEVFAKLHAATR